MKLKFLPLLVILSLLTLAIFSMWGMDIANHTSHSLCPVTSAVAECPEAGLAMYNSHLSILDYFAQPRVSIGTLAVMMVILMVNFSVILTGSVFNQHLIRFKGKLYQFYKTIINPQHDFATWFTHRFSLLPEVNFGAYETA